MLKRRSFYYYDSDTCTYVKAEATPQVVVRKMIFWTVFVLGTVYGAKMTFDNYFVSFQQSEHLTEQNEHVSHLEVLNTQLDAYDVRLADMYHKNNSLYRPVVGKSQIPLSYWNGGRGGSSLYDKTNHNLVNKTQIRIERLLHQIELLRNSYSDVGIKAALTEKDLRNLPSIMPTNGALISGFGYRLHPVSGHQKLHEGIDFACQIGTPIYAPGNGVVGPSGNIGNGYGINVNIDHQNGYKTKFAHMSEAIVSEGSQVKRGQLIGYSGNTGLSTGPHLHYEITHNDVKIDPIDFFYEDLTPREYRKLKLNKSEITKEVIKAELSTAPAMD
jgi:murein DD-endopeptidase MepM/ murein hydrolase activator NlpD